MIRFALRDITHYRRETVGVIGQVAVGIALFVVALSFVGAIGQNADRLLFGTVGAPWLVQPATTSDPLSVDNAEIMHLKSRAGAASVRSRLDLSASLSNPSASSARPASASVTLVGVDLSAEPALGKNFGLQMERLGENRIVLAATVARQLGVVAGDALILAVGRTELPYTVDAVVSPSTPNFLLESWVLADRQALAEELYADPDRTNALLIDAPQTEAARSTIDAARANLESTTTLSLWSDTNWSSLMLGPTIWGLLLVAASTFTFFIICIGLTSLVYSALLARARDFAVLKAAGLRAGSLRRMYLGEVAAQYLIGYIVGAILAAILIVAMNAIGVTSTDTAFTFAVGSTTLAFLATWWAFLAPFAIGLVLTIAVLWFPIRSVCSQPVLDLLEIR
jgi:ABC-type lipoprotein release transport system permease subunit